MARCDASRRTNDGIPPRVTPDLLVDVHATLDKHGWRLDENGQTALVAALWQLANRPGTTIETYSESDRAATPTTTASRRSGPASPEDAAS